MSTYNLDKILRPASVAVVGASAKQGTLGYFLMDNLRRGGYEGKIYPVNPHYAELAGFQAYSSLKKIGQPVDLAVITTRIETVPRILEDGARVGLGGAIIVSGGGKETGKKGKDAEAKIKKVAEQSRIRILGPNCFGLVCSELKLNASASSHMPLPGGLAFVSQSGAICSAILDLSLKMRIGISYFVSIGSVVDVDFGDLINYLGDDPEVGSIVLNVESLTAFRKFMSAARAVSRVKPIVVLKSGRSRAGARAVASHTGVLAGEDAVYDAAFKRAGIVRVNTIEELFDCAELVAKQPRPAGAGLAIVTNAGGPGVMAADALASYGMEPVSLSTETISRLDEVLPPSWSRGNPVDILDDATPERYRKAVEICMSAPEINSVLIMMAPQGLSHPTGVAEAISPILSRTGRSVFTVWLGASDVEKGREIFIRASIPTYETPERAIRAFMHIYSYVRNQEILQQVPQRLPQDPQFDRDTATTAIRETLKRGGSLLTEAESKTVLKAYGIPVNEFRLAESPDEAVRAAEELGYPVAMKIQSPDIAHKSDINGVLLDLKNDREVLDGFARILANAASRAPQARLLGVSVQTMIETRGVELIVGSKRDLDFGPVILFGTGGIFTEVLKDRSIGLPPLNRLLARNLMESTKVHQLLKGYRNRPQANLVLLEEILIRVSQLVTDFPEIVELDINPLVTPGDGALALDARISVAPSTVPAPLHLVISPYPAQYETHTVTRAGIEILLRPIKPEDAPLLIELFDTLSPTSIYFRFFRPLRSLSHELLARFTQVDYDRDIALVAIQHGAEGEEILGVARFMGDPDMTRAEFAIVVGDPWQGKGVGAALLNHCMVIARERGIKRIWGMVLAENTTMLALGRKLGFKVARSPEGGDYELKIDLDEASA